jgi:positive regulator of sigma E activity
LKALKLSKSLINFTEDLKKIIVFLVYHFPFFRFFFFQRIISDYYRVKNFIAFVFNNIVMQMLFLKKYKRRMKLKKED